MLNGRFFFVLLCNVRNSSFQTRFCRLFCTRCPRRCNCLIPSAVFNPPSNPPSNPPPSPHLASSYNGWRGVGGGLEGLWRRCLLTAIWRCGNEGLWMAPQSGGFEAVVEYGCGEGASRGRRWWRRFCRCSCCGLRRRGFLCRGLLGGRRRRGVRAGRSGRCRVRRGCRCR